MASDNDIKNALRLLEIQQRSTEEEAKLKEIRESLTKEGKKILDTLDEILKKKTQSLETAEEEFKIAKELAQLHGEDAIRMEGEIDLLQTQLRIETEKLAVIGKGQAGYEKIAEEILRIKKKLEEVNEELSTHNEQLEGAESLAKNLGAAIGLQVRFQESFIGKLNQTLDGIVNNAEAQQKFKEQVKETFHPMNLLAGAAAKVFQSTVLAAKAFDESVASFNAATGAAGEYNEAIENAVRGSRHLGVGFAEASGAMAALLAGMSDFSSLNKQTATEITTTTAALSNLGIDASVTAQNLQTLTKHMGLSAQAAMNQQVQLAEFARTIGVAPAQLASDFAAATPKLVAYGAAGEKVFKDLAVTAKSTGVEMQTLLGIAEQFDTFEGSAQAAGKLNAILGGPLLNSVSLLTANEADRIRMMRDAVVQSGKNWESLNKFEQQAIASAAGISDLTIASGLFGNNSEEVMRKQADFNTMLEKSQSVTKKLEQIMMGFAIAVGPMVDVLHSIVSWISELISEYEAFFNVLGIALVAISALVVGLNLFVKVGAIFFSTVTMMRAPIEAMKKPVEEVGKDMTKNLAQGIRRVGAAAKSGGTSLMKLGAAILMVGAGIGLAATGVAQLVGAFAGLNGEQILGAVLAIGVFMVAIIGLAKVMLTAGTIATVGMLAFGAAFLLIGAGVKMMTEGIATMVTSFVTLLETAGKMTNLSQVGNVFKQMASGVDALGKSLSNISTSSIEALAQLADAFVWLGGMTMEPSISFKTSMEGLATALDAAKNAGVEVLMATATVGANFAPANKPVMIEPGAVAPTGKQPRTPIGPGATATQTSPTTVQLVLNDREFARAVINVMDKKMNLRTG